MIWALIEQVKHYSTPSTLSSRCSIQSMVHGQQSQRVSCTDALQARQRDLTRVARPDPSIVNNKKEAKPNDALEREPQHAEHRVNHRKRKHENATSDEAYCEVIWFLMGIY